MSSACFAICSCDEKYGCMLDDDNYGGGFSNYDKDDIWVQ